MANVKDLIVNGDARIVGKLYANQSMPDGVFHLANVGGTAAVTTSPYTASKWYTTADDPRITALYSGLTISLKIPVAGHGTYGTLLNVNGLGNHPVVYNVNSHISTRYAVGGTIILTYNATQTANAYNNNASATSFTGVWQLEDYDYDSTNIYQLRDNNAPAYLSGYSGSGDLYRYQLCLSTFDGGIMPYNNVSNAPTNYAKELNTTGIFNPFGPIYYYNSTTTVTNGNAAAGNTLYQHINFDCRYSMNIDSSGSYDAGTALEPGMPVYIKALYNSSYGFAQLTPNDDNDNSGSEPTKTAYMSDNYFVRSSIVQDLPSENPNSSSDDNSGGVARSAIRSSSSPFYIYIYLGRASSKYQIELDVNHPVYAWDDNAGACLIFGGSGGGGMSSVPPATDTTLGGFHVSYDEITGTLYLDTYADSSGGQTE